MSDTQSAFVRNKLLLYEAQQTIVPLVLRDFVVMKEMVESLVPLLEYSLRECELIAGKLMSVDHGDGCDACLILRNMHFRFQHDLSLFRAHIQNTNGAWTGITKKGCVNSAAPESFLSVALTTRALLDSFFRSSVLYSVSDIRAYNKQLADSLSSFSKLVWSTLPQNIDHNIKHVLDEYAQLSNSKRNSSDLYADPAPTFKAKVEHMRGTNSEAGFAPFFDECESFYSALSDMVHGGSAAMSASYLKGPQIVLGLPELKYVASANQLAELIGVASVLSLKLLVHFYIPVLVQALSRVEGVEEVRDNLASLQFTLVEKAQGFTF